MNLQQNILLSNKKFINANVLKWIALVTMIIDHVGAGVLERGMIQNSYEMYQVDEVLRYIGRVSFPIYCFLLVEGYKYTSSRIRYLVRMLVFAFISEVPFDYCFFGRINWQYQNVFFTLVFGLSGMIIAGLVENEDVPCYRLFQLMAFLAMGFLAWQCYTDYSWKGVFLIGILYMLRDDRLIQCVTGAVAFSYEVTSVFAFVFIYFYTGIRKKDINKYIYYAIYPLHLTAFYFIHKYVLIG